MRDGGHPKAMAGEGMGKGRERGKSKFQASHSAAETGVLSGQGAQGQAGRGMGAGKLRPS